MNNVEQNHEPALAALAVDPEIDRRHSGRVQTVFRIARVLTSTDEGLARVQNISDHGVRLQLHIPVLPGDMIVVELAEGMRIAGRVVWTLGMECGLELDQAVDSAGLLAELALQAKNATGRPLRLPVAVIAITRSAIGTRVVEVTDISQRGMKLVHDGSFTEGLHVKVCFSSGMERRGVVRWSHDNLAGLILLEPFSTKELGCISKL